MRQPRTGKSPGLPRKAGKSSSDLPRDPCGADFSNEKSGIKEKFEITPEEKSRKTIVKEKRKNVGIDFLELIRESFKEGFKAG